MFCRENNFRLYYRLSDKLHFKEYSLKSVTLRQGPFSVNCANSLSLFLSFSLFLGRFRAFLHR